MDDEFEKWMREFGRKTTNQHTSYVLDHYNKFKTKMIEQARASEREKCKSEYEPRILRVTNDGLLLAKNMEKEAYAKGKADEKADKEAERKFAKPAIDKFDELLRQEAYKKGQNDLIAEIDKLIQNPKPENACKHQWNYTGKVMVCMWCGKTKPEKPRCCACGKTECEHQPIYKKKVKP